jgi:hypothetical protein
MGFSSYILEWALPEEVLFLQQRVVQILALVDVPLRPGTNLMKTLHLN